MALLYQFRQRLTEGQLEEWISSISKQCLLTGLQHCYSQFGYGRVDGFLPKSDGGNNSLKLEMTNFQSTNLTLLVKTEDGLLASDGWKPKSNSVLDIGCLFTNESEFHSERYEKLRQEMASDEVIKADIDKTAHQVGERFLGCVIDFKFFKLYVTSIDVFVRLDDSVDDCANRIVTKESQNSREAKLQELVIRDFDIHRLS